MSENFNRGTYVNKLYDPHASLKEFIANILNRYAIDAHIMETKEIADAYEACGEVNLEIANL